MSLMVQSCGTGSSILNPGEFAAGLHGQTTIYSLYHRYTNQCKYKHKSIYICICVLYIYIYIHTYIHLSLSLYLFLSIYVCVYPSQENSTAYGVAGPILETCIFTKTSYFLGFLVLLNTNS